MSKHNEQGKHYVTHRSYSNLLMVPNYVSQLLCMGAGEVYYADQDWMSKKQLCAVCSCVRIFWIKVKKEVKWSLTAVNV